jgi:hypothetical protein
MRRRSKAGLALSAGIAVLLLASAAPALPAEDPPVGVSPSLLPLKVKLDDLRDSRTTEGEASGTVMVTETTPPPASTSPPTPRTGVRSS